MELNVISICIAGFAAIISMISLIWNIINAILSRKAKLRVDFRVVQQMISDPLQGLGNPIPYFDIKITNVGAGTRYINAPTFVFNNPKAGIIDKESKEFTVINFISPIKYPLELVVGKEFNYNVNIGDFVNHFKGQLNPNDKIWIKVLDTHNKRYRSNKIKLKVVTDTINVCQKIARNG